MVLNLEIQVQSRLASLCESSLEIDVSDVAPRAELRTGEAGQRRSISEECDF